MDDPSFSWLIGGPQGSGVDSAASTMARACALGGLWVFGRREYHSNIMGLHSYFQIRVSEKVVRSPTDRVDLLVSFEEETLARHAASVAPGGAIIYDPGKATKRLEEIRSFHGPAAESTRDRLEQHGFEPSVAGVLKEAEGRGVRPLPYPYSDVMTQFAHQHPEIDRSKLARTTNTSAVAASLALLAFAPDLLERSVRAQFAAKPGVAELNANFGRFAFDAAQDRFANDRGRRLPVRSPHGRLFLTGTQAIAMGKLLGGCRLQTYYPITPASDESEFLEAHESFPLRTASASAGGTGEIAVVQTEDEIAAVTMAAGAALAGTRSATSTSGPGFSLMAEGLGFAGINEIPIVVTLYQRAGPSTGLPTRHEQGDLRFALHAGHGEFPRIVIASGDAEECLGDAVRSLNYAARFQMPVIHLVDKALASSTSIVPVPELSGLRVEAGDLLTGSGPDGGYLDYRRFALAPGGVSPRAPLGTPGVVSWHTGDEHDEVGHIDEDPENRRRMMEKRAEKLATVAREIPAEDKVRLFGPAEAETVVVSWGSTKGAILDALDQLEGEGQSVRFLQVRFLCPFPAAEVAAVLGRAHRRVGLEMNYSGQLAGVITEATGLAFHHLLVKFNGRPMSQDEVYAGLRACLEGSASARTVMTHGI